MWGSMARKLKFGSPAWRKKYLKKRKPAKRKNVKRNRRPVKRRVAQRRPVKRTVKHANPSKLKRLKRSTGWMKASAVKIVKKGRQMQVLVRKKAR
jgi:hypothetical protein